MPRFIGFLRAINAVNGRALKMESLRRIFSSLGFSGVSTFAANGNVLFETTIEDTQTLKNMIENGLRDALGYEVAAFIRTESDLAEIAGYDPFTESEKNRADEFLVIFLEHIADKELKRRVMSFKSEANDFRLKGCEVYWLRCKKPGTPNFFSVPLEKMLGMQFTTRSEETIRRLAMNMKMKGRQPHG